MARSVIPANGRRDCAVPSGVACGRSVTSCRYWKRNVPYIVRMYHAPTARERLGVEPMMMMAL